MKNILKDYWQIFKNIVWEARGGYQPKSFWEKLGKTFFDDDYQRGIYEQHRWIAEKIKQLKPKNILEVGCGFGRNIKFLVDSGFPAKKITGVDISSSMLKQAREYLSGISIKLIESDASSLPFKDETFDLCLLHGILMHIPPDKIDATVKEIVRVSKEYVLCVEQNYNGNKFTFVHQYTKLFLKYGGKVLEQKSIKSGLDLFLIKLE